MSSRPPVRRLPGGAELVVGGTHFRVWAPDRRRVDVVFDGAGEGPPCVMPLAREPKPDGYWSGRVAGIGAGARYRLRLDGGSTAPDNAFPDPASRWQPDGPHGPSVVVDPAAFAWTDAAWRGITAPERQVLYELDDWVVTPRRGKPVEINTLWYNALTNLARWTREEHGADAAAPYEDAAGRARRVQRALLVRRGRVPL